MQLFLTFNFENIIISMTFILQLLDLTLDSFFLLKVTFILWGHLRLNIKLESSLYSTEYSTAIKDRQ